MKLKSKIYGFVVGVMLFISIIVVRFGKHLSPRQTENIFEFTVETISDLGKVETLVNILDNKTDSLESISFLNCLNSLNFFNSSFSSEVDNCYDNAITKANINNSPFIEVLLKMENRLYEMKDNHFFNMSLDKLIRDRKYVNFDSIWNLHFDNPSTIDIQYKKLLLKYYQNSVATQKSLDSTYKLLNKIKEFE